MLLRLGGRCHIVDRCHVLSGLMQHLRGWLRREVCRTRGLWLPEGRGYLSSGPEKRCLCRRWGRRRRPNGLHRRIHL